MKGILFVVLLACAFCADKHFPQFVECLGKSGKGNLVEAINNKNIVKIGKIVKDDLFSGDFTIVKCFPFKLKELQVEGDENKPDFETKDLQVTEAQVKQVLECLGAIGKGTPCYIAIAEIVATKNFTKIPSMLLKCSKPAMEIISDCVVPIYNGVKKMVQDAKKKK